MVHEIHTRVRYKETDRMGALHHSNYFTYFEMARTEFFRALGMSYRALENSGILLVVAEAHSRYLHPAGYDDEVRVTCEVREVSGAKVKFAYNVYLMPQDKLIATGHTLLGCVNREGRPRRLPIELRSLLERSARSTDEPPRCQGRQE